MSSIALLLSPLWLSWKNSFFRGAQSWTRRLSLALLAGLFWIGTYLVVRRVLRYFETVYELGPALAYQLLLIILLTFLSMLLFSNLVAALSTFFLARDLDLIQSTPVSPNGVLLRPLDRHDGQFVLDGAVLFSCRSLPPTARCSAAASSFIFGLPRFCRCFLSSRQPSAHWSPISWSIACRRGASATCSFSSGCSPS